MSRIESIFGRPNEQDRLNTRYTLLKTEPFYDPEYDVWRESIRYPGSLGDFPQRPRTHDIVTSDQLLGVLTESIFDPKKAVSILKDFKQSEYLTDRGWLWGYHDNDMAPRLSTKIPAYTQLVGIIAESIVDEEWAKALLDSLRRSGFHNPKTGDWFDFSGDRKSADITAHYAGVVAVALFDRDEALYMLEEFENKKRGTNPERINKKNSAESGEVITSDQLWRILATSIFDRESARNDLNDLKSGGLFDSRNERWFRWKNGFVTDVADSEDQLLGIITERAVEV